MNEFENSEKGIIFTEGKYVDIMMQLSNLDAYEVERLKVLENSCGTGNILVKIVDFFIEKLRKRDFSDQKIKKILEKNITGYEIEEAIYRKCLDNLDKIAQKKGIANVEWNIINGDFLKDNKTEKYDLIIGNPPYIAYKNLNKEEITYIKNNFDSCKFGKFDYYFAFVEKSYKLLEVDGKLVYLIPTSMFKNKSAHIMRSMIKDDVRMIIQTEGNIFMSATISASIIIILKSSYERSQVDKNIKITYQKNHINYLIDKRDLDNDSWIFSRNKETVLSNTVRDFYDVRICPATLANSIFVFDKGKEDDFYSRKDGLEYKIESELLKKSGSPRTFKNKIEQYIIFPYYLYKGKYVSYTEEEMEKKFPIAYQYLKLYESELRKRDRDRGSYWYEFGRGQAINSVDYEKIIISTIITKTVNYSELLRGVIPYSGMYITAKHGNDFHMIKLILESKDFLNYLYEVGAEMNGDSIRVSPRHILDFPISKYKGEKYELRLSNR